MIPQISSALSNGFTTKQVIDFLLKKFPQHSEKIKSAMAAGFTTDQVIKFLSGGKKEMSEETSNQTEHEQTRGVYTKQRENVNKAGVAVAGLGATALAAPMAAQALKRAIPQNLLGSIPQPSQQAQATSPEITASQTQQPPVSQPNIAQPQQPIQPEVKSIDVGGLLNKSGLKKHVDDLSKRIKDPKQIAAVLYSKYPDEMKAFQKESGKNMEDAIGDYLSSNPMQSSANPVKLDEKLPKNEEILQEQEKKPPKIEKSSIVASPNGIGTVKEVRNGNALIDVDGKLHKVKEEELESEPEEVKNAKFDFDLNSIPEDLRSAPLNEVYLPHDRRHVTVKYNVGLKPQRYIYFRKDGKNIPTDYINKIVDGVQLPTTSGKSFWGVWNADKADSRGSANYHELVKNAQEEGEPDDPSKEYWFIQEEALYEHPYMEKKGKEELRQLEKEFNEKRKKRKKKGS